MATYTHDVMATVGTYKNKDGEEKKQYIKCGAAFTHEGGNISIKLDAVPVTPDWSGWLSLFEKRDYEPQGERHASGNRAQSNPTYAPDHQHSQAGHPMPDGAGQGGTDQVNDDVPFNSFDPWNLNM